MLLAMAARFLWPVLFGTAVVHGMACGARSELYIPDPERRVESRGGGGQGGEDIIPPDCATLQSSSELAPLDMFVVVDASGSMGEALGGTITKWDRARAALSEFARDTRSTGMTMAMSFFPIRDTYIPEYCGQSDECGLVGNCDFFSRCTTGEAFCTTQQDCVDAGFPGGSCQPMGFGRCSNHLTCQLEANSSPALELTALPSVAVVDDVFSKRAPYGGTPTRIAIRGALEAARQRQLAAPDNKIIVLLVTDGFPTEQCDDDAIFGNYDLVGNVAAEAAAGAADGFQTFVVGIFGSDNADMAQQNFDTIAAAGGSGEAIIVNGALVDALNAVRLRAKPCELSLSGDIADPENVWLRLISDDGSGEPIWVPRRDSEADCDENPGFYFDVPLGSGTPSRVTLCPDTCALLGGGAQRRVEIVTSCDE